MPENIFEEKAKKIVGIAKQVGKAKFDPFEALMVEQLRRRRISEWLARSAARQCSNRIWRNGMVSGAAAVVLVSATHGNVPGAVAGGSMAAIGGLYTFLISDACKGVRELSGWEVSESVNQVLRGH